MIAFTFTASEDEEATPASTDELSTKERKHFQGQISETVLWMDIFNGNYLIVEPKGHRCASFCLISLCWQYFLAILLAQLQAMQQQPQSERLSVHRQHRLQQLLSSLEH